MAIFVVKSIVIQINSQVYGSINCLFAESRGERNSAGMGRLPGAEV